MVELKGQEETRKLENKAIRVYSKKMGTNIIIPLPSDNQEPFNVGYDESSHERWGRTD